MLDHLAQFLDALLVARDVGLEVGEVVAEVARRIVRGGEQFLGLGLQQPSAGDQLEVVDQHAFLVDMGRVGRHRAGRDTADLGVMAARRDIEQDVLAGLVEPRRDDGDVGQMSAAVVRRIQHEHVARHDGAAALLDDRLDALAHRAQMHRDVRRVGDQAAVGGEHRAREVEPLLDVDRIRRVLEHHAHLLGDRHEQVVEHLEHHRIRVGADRGLARTRLDTVQHELVAAVDLGAPAGLQDGGRDGLLDDRRADDAAARVHRVAVIDVGLM